MSVRSTKMIFAWIESCGVRMSSPRTKSRDARDAAPGIGQDERVGAGVGHDAAAVLGQDALDRLGERAGLGVVDPDDARLQRLERVEGGERRRRVHADDPAGHLLGREALAGEDRLEGLRPGLIPDLGVDLTLHVLAEDDGPAAEGREAGHHVRDARAVPGDGDPGLVRAGQHAGAADGHLGLPGGRRGGDSRGFVGRIGRSHLRSLRLRVSRRPGLEALARLEAHADGAVGAVHLVGLRALEVDDDPDDVRAELRVAEVEHPAPLHAVVEARGGRAQLGADDVEHQAVGRRRAGNRARRRHRFTATTISVLPAAGARLTAVTSPLPGPSARIGVAVPEDRGGDHHPTIHARHGVSTSCLRSERVSWRSNPKS